MAPEVAAELEASTHLGSWTNGHSVLINALFRYARATDPVRLTL